VKRNAELFFPAEFADDFPVSLQVSSYWGWGARGAGRGLAISGSSCSSIQRILDSSCSTHAAERAAQQGKHLRRGTAAAHMPPVLVGHGQSSYQHQHVHSPSQHACMWRGPCDVCKLSGFNSHHTTLHHNLHVAFHAPVYPPPQQT
jgi:hypothetical protein